jgi:hypothetical protein
MNYALCMKEACLLCCDMPIRAANTIVRMQAMSYICWIQAQYNHNDEQFQSSNKKQLCKIVSNMSQHSNSFQCTSSYGMDTYPVDLVSVDPKVWVRDPGWASPVTETAMDEEHS